MPLFGTSSLRRGAKAAHFAICMVFSSQSRSFTRPSWRTLHLTPRRYTSSPTRESLPGRLGCWTLNSISQSAPALTRRRDGVTVEAPLDCHGPIAPTGCVPRAASAAIVCHGNCQGGAPRWAKTPIVLPRLCLLINSLVASLNHLPLQYPRHTACVKNNREQESSH